MCHLQLATGSLQSHTLSAVAFSAMRPDGVVRFIFIFFLLLSSIRYRVSLKKAIFKIYLCALA